MAITQAIANSFKTQILQGVHNFTAVSAVATATGAGTGVYTVTLTGGANNGLAGQVVVCTGATTAANNGTFVITASNATTITTTNTNSSATGPTFSTCTLGDTFKLALYTSTAAMDKTTTNYSATNEVGNSGTYAAGGGTLVSTTPVLSTDTAVCNFATLSFTSATITARGALIYNSSKVLNAAGGAAVVILDFGADKTSTAGTFTITFPTADAANAIVRIA